jgi:hypothetical protein
VDLVYLRNRIADSRHDLRRQLEAQIHALGADMKQQVARRGDSMAPPTNDREIVGARVCPRYQKDRGAGQWSDYRLRNEARGTSLCSMECLSRCYATSSATRALSRADGREIQNSVMPSRSWTTYSDGLNCVSSKASKESYLRFPRWFP